MQARKLATGRIELTTDERTVVIGAPKREQASHRRVIRDVRTGRRIGHARCTSRGWWALDAEGELIDGPFTLDMGLRRAAAAVAGGAE